MARQRPARPGKEVYYGESWTFGPSLQQSEWRNAATEHVEECAVGGGTLGAESTSREEKAALRTLAALHRIELPATPPTTATA